MASLHTAYFDESGTHEDSDAIVFAGFVSNVTELETFTQKWQEVLSESNLEYFRMSEFENRRGQFDGWTEDARQDLLNKLLQIIDEHTFWSIGIVVVREWIDDHYLTLSSTYAEMLMVPPR